MQRTAHHREDGAVPAHRTSLSRIPHRRSVRDLGQESFERKVVVSTALHDTLWPPFFSRAISASAPAMTGISETVHVARADTNTRQTRYRPPAAGISRWATNPGLELLVSDSRGS